MPAPIRVSFQVAGDKALMNVFSSVEKRVQQMSAAYAKAARTSASMSTRMASGAKAGADATTAVTIAGLKRQEAAERAHAARVDKIRERSAINAGRHAAKAAAAEARAREGRAGVVASAGRTAARGTLSSIGGIAGGLGITAGGFAITNAVVNAAKLRQQAVRLTQSSRDSAGNKTQDPAELMAFAQRMGTTHGVDPASVLEGLSTVSARAGGGKGLKEARKDWEELTKIGVAWSVSQEDMGGVVAAALDAGVAPGKELLSLVENIVAQGKLGAIEFSDLAGELGRLKGAGLSFDESPAEMLKSMVAFSQVAARAQVSPEESRTAVRDIGRDITTSNKFLRKSGIDTESNGKIRSPAQLIADIIEKSETEGLFVPGETGRQKGSVGRDRLFTGTSQAIMRQFSEFYTKGFGEGKDKKFGKEGVMAAYQSFSGATLGKGETAAAYAENMSTEVKQAEVAFQKFNVELSKLLPKFAEMLPAVLSLAQSFAKLAVWASENPFKALGGIFAAHLTKELAAAGIGNLIKGLLGGGGGAGVPVGAAGGLGKAGSAVAVAGAGILGYAAGDTLAHYLGDPAEKEGRTEAKGVQKEYWKLNSALSTARRGGPLSDEERERLRGFATKAAHMGLQADAISNPSGLDALNPLSQMQAMGARNELGQADKAGFDALAAELKALADGKGKTPPVPADWAAAVASLNDAATSLKSASNDRSGKPPARN